MAGQSKMSARRGDVPYEVRGAIVARCFELSKNGHFARGDIPMVAAEYGIHRATVYRIYNRALKQLKKGYLDLSTLHHNYGHARVLNPTALQAALHLVPFWLRTTVHDTAIALMLSHTTFYDSFVQQGHAVQHSNHLKPHLTDKNKEARLNWVLQFLHDNDDGTMSLMYDMVHIDEKWFDLTNKVNNYYVAPGEEPPIRSVVNKARCPKLMFLTAVARPRYDLTQGRMFDGKIGCWAFVCYEPAKRNSKYRPAGTLCAKSISVTRDVSRTYLIEKVIPEIKKRWPRSYFDGPQDRRRPIFIQQDNAKAHVLENDPQVVLAGTSGGWSICIKNQPPNSPDFNVLDLGIFNALSKAQSKVVKSNADDLIAAVYGAFDELPSFKINHCFLTLQRLMSEVVVDGGGNNYSIPHMHKMSLAAAKRLPERMRMTEVAMSKLNIGPSGITVTNATIMTVQANEDESNNDDE